MSNTKTQHILPMTTEEAIAALDAIDGSDPEKAHGEADDVLKKAVDPRVREAYERIVARCSWWATA